MILRCKQTRSNKQNQSAVNQLDPMDNYQFINFKNEKQQYICKITTNNTSIYDPEKDNDFPVEGPVEAVRSQYFQMYSSYLQESRSSLSQGQIMRNMNEMSIKYNHLQKQPTDQSQTSQVAYQCQKQFSINCSQIIVFQVRISTFQIKVSLLNIIGKNPFLKYAEIKKGIYGRVYYYSFLNQIAAIKILVFPSPKSISFIINQAIKEYAIMKICSSLKCAPFLNKIFGFDMVVFDDSVMFTMEKCKTISVLSPRIIEELNTNLKIMHNHHIIHFDIKPDNIMMSEVQNRPVFIDFGFSQIIKEKAGTKSRIFFRGSPAFCGEQMSKIIQKSQEKSFVDVYYNDIISLKHSFSYMRLEIDQMNSQVQATNDNLECQQIECDLMLALIKYFLLTKRSRQIIMLLQYKDCIILQRHGNKVINFFQNPSGASLFEHIYSQISKELARYIDHLVLQNYFRHYYRSFSIKNRRDQQNVIQETQQIFLSRVNFGSQELHCNIGRQKYKQFLEIKDIFLNPKFQEIAKHILIQVLRFDFKNQSIDEKIQLSMRHNHIYKANSSANLDSIRVTFKLLLQYCLIQPYSPWKKQHIFIIITQLMILDYNLSLLLPTFFQTIPKMYQSFIDRIYCSIELLKLLYLMMFKHKSIHPDMIKAGPLIISRFGRLFLQETLQKFKSSENHEIQTIIIAFRQILGPRRNDKIIQNYQKLNSILNNINENTFKRQLLLFIYLQGLQLNNTEKRSQQAYKMLHYLTQFNDDRTACQSRYNLHYSIFFISNILAVMENYKELSRLYQSVQKSINCLQVSEKFKFETCTFIFSDDCDSQKMLKYSIQLLECFQSQSTAKLADQFSQMIDKIRKSPEFVKSHPQIIVRFSQTFAVLQKKSIPRLFILTMTQIQKIMYKFNIISFLLSVNPSFQQTFITDIIEFLHGLLLQIGENEAKEEQIYIKFHLYAYLSAMYYHVKQYKKLLQSFQILYDISLQINNPIAKNYFLKEIIMVASIIPDQQKLKYYISQFFNISRSISSLSRYFEHQGKYFIASTLNYFQRIGDLAMFYDFLVELAEFIAYYPNEANFKHFTNNIEKLMGLNGYLLLMKFDQLLKIKRQRSFDCHNFVFYYIYSIQIEANRQTKQLIFSKITKNIGYLHNFIKEYILRKCFGHIAFICSDKKRRLNYLYLRFGFKYIRNNEFHIYFAKKFKKIKSSRCHSRLIKMLMLKIQQALKC